MQAEVLNAIDEARQMMGRDPAGAHDRLKIYEENVRRAPELDADTRAQLLSRLQAALQQAATLAPIQTAKDIEDRALQATVEERRRALEDLTRREQRVEQLMNRFESLMDERRYFDAEAVADMARELAPHRPATMAAMHTATMSGYWAESEALRQARWRGMVDTLQTVERSHIPTPDEPPIVYPDREFWIALTARRKEFASVSLDQTNPTEKKILQELDKPTIIEFVETPLQRRGRLPEGLSQDRDPTGQEGPGRCRSGDRYAHQPQPARDLAQERAAAAAQGVRSDLRDRRRSADDHDGR